MNRLANVFSLLLSCLGALLSLLYIQNHLDTDSLLIPETLKRLQEIDSDRHSFYQELHHQWMLKTLLRLQEPVLDLSHIPLREIPACIVNGNIFMETVKLSCAHFKTLDSLPRLLMGVKHLILINASNKLLESLPNLPFLESFQVE